MANQIPIDPALQQQAGPSAPAAYYQAYPHYPGTYQYSNPGAAPTPAPAASGSGGGGKVDNTDVDALKDALGSAGVDLRAEEESLHRSHDQPQSYRTFDDRTRKQPPKPSFNTAFLGATVRAIAPQHKVTKVPEDTVSYLALALRARLQDLLTAMIAASNHRTSAQFDRPASLYPNGDPMWSLVVRSDVGKQLAVIERIEREEEMRIRRERKEREDAQAAHAARLSAQATGGSSDGLDDEYDEDGPKRKKKKEGPGVTAKNMSEDVRKKISNATASHAAGISTSKYSWMTGGGGAAKSKAPAPPAVVSAAAATSVATSGAPSPTIPATTPTMGSSWARPYVSSTRPAQPTLAEAEDVRKPITMRDALFVIENERGHGGGRGTARGFV